MLLTEIIEKYRLIVRYFWEHHVGLTFSSISVFITFPEKRVIIVIGSASFNVLFTKMLVHGADDFSVVYFKTELAVLSPAWGR